MQALWIYACDPCRSKGRSSPVAPAALTESVRTAVNGGLTRGGSSGSSQKGIGSALEAVALKEQLDEATKAAWMARDRADQADACDPEQALIALKKGRIVVESITSEEYLKVSQHVGDDKADQHEAGNGHHELLPNG